MEMRLRKRIAGFAAAGALALAMAPMAAFGAAGDLTADSQIKVENLKNAADTAQYYKVFEYSDSAKHGWKFTDAFSSVAQSILDKNPGTTKTAVECLLDGISADEAGVIAAAASAADGNLTGGTSKTAEVDPGLYLVLVTPQDNDIIYAPMFVSADYYTDPDTSKVDAATESLPSPTVAVAKTTKLTVDKKSTNSTLDNNNDAGTDDGETTKNNSLAAGSIVSFSVNTNVPNYTTNVKNPKFTVSDTVSNGLKIKTDSVKVKIGSGTAFAVQASNYYKADGSAGTAAESAFKVSTLSDGTWKLEFTEHYLTKEATGSPAVEVTYDAEVQESAFNVNEMKNTAEIEYTHLPDGTTEKQTDDTHHYTYSLDGNLNGTTSTEEKTKELEKVGVDEDGKPIVTEEETTVNGEKVTNALAGAKFTLTAKNNGKVYEATSQSDGTITFNGLDAGEYELVETEAPKGWVKDPDKYSVVITPSFKVDDDGCYVLDTYTVVITNKTTQESKTSTFAMTYTGEAGSAVMTSSDGDLTTFIKNKKAGLLPETGGYGIFFYVFVGAAIMALAVFLARRNRKTTVNAA